MVARGGIYGDLHGDGQAVEPVKANADGAIVFWYKNYKGDEGYRRVIPVIIRYGTSEWHKEPQWLMLGDDTVNNKRREFAMRDMLSVIGPSIFTISKSA